MKLISKKKSKNYSYFQYRFLAALLCVLVGVLAISVQFSGAWAKVEGSSTADIISIDGGSRFLDPEPGTQEIEDGTAVSEESNEDSEGDEVSGSIEDSEGDEDSDEDDDDGSSYGGAKNGSSRPGGGAGAVNNNTTDDVGEAGAAEDSDEEKLFGLFIIVDDTGDADSDDDVYADEAAYEVWSYDIIDGINYSVDTDD